MQLTLLRILLGEKYARQKFVVAVMLYCSILAVGMMPGMRTEIGHLGSGVFLHVFAYAAIAALLFRSRINDKIQLSESTVIIILIAMAAIDELAQSLVPYRTATFTDWLIDVCAGGTTVVVLTRILRWKKSKIAVPQAKAG